MIGLMNTDDPFTGTMNVGNPQEVIILDLAETVLCLTNSRSRFAFQSLPQDDRGRTSPISPLHGECSDGSLRLLS